MQGRADKTRSYLKRQPNRTGPGAANEVSTPGGGPGPRRELPQPLGCARGADGTQAPCRPPAPRRHGPRRRPGRRIVGKPAGAHNPGHTQTISLHRRTRLHELQLGARLTAHSATRQQRLARRHRLALRGCASSSVKSVLRSRNLTRLPIRSACSPSAVHSNTR